MLKVNNLKNEKKKKTLSRDNCAKCCTGDIRSNFDEKSEWIYSKL